MGASQCGQLSRPAITVRLHEGHLRDRAMGGAYLPASPQPTPEIACATLKIGVNCLRPIESLGDRLTIWHILLRE